MKLRCTRVDNDIVLEVENTLLVQDLKKLYFEKAGLKESELDLDHTRIFFKGKEIKKNMYLGDYQFDLDLVLNVFIRKNEPDK